MTKWIHGPTILMGDGLYFDYVAPDATGMTIEDYAWGIATNIRFSGQTRLPSGHRCAYTVAQHCVMMAGQMLEDRCTFEQAYQGLMHESDEVVWPDIPGPAKMLLPAGVRELIARAGAAIERRFAVPTEHKDLVKEYDIRMLATEKRCLVPHAKAEQWAFTQGFEPFGFDIEPWPIDYAVGRFMALHAYLAPLGQMAGAVVAADG